jgi:hypothetical protein
MEWNVARGEGVNMSENMEWREAKRLVLETDRSLFLTGRAGTGKTTFLGEIRKECHKPLVVTAPTGVAAINAQGETLHSFFHLSLGPYLPGSALDPKQFRIKKEKLKLIRATKLLIIDEISMVRADVLDAVDATLKRIRSNTRPFGGVQLLLIGDLYQLPPVAKDEDWQLLGAQYDTPFFFSSKAFGQLQVATVELKTVYRQTDTDFIELLNALRHNRLTDQQWEVLNRRCPDRPELLPREEVITLCSHRWQADSINEENLKALTGSKMVSEGVITGKFNEKQLPSPQELILKKGAQVMFTRNDPSEDKRYFNGKLGVVTNWKKDEVEVRCVGETQPLWVPKVDWDQIMFKFNEKTKSIEQERVGRYRQFPLAPSWAITIHKSQGLTFDRLIVEGADAFAPGQIYVALSRCRTLKGLWLRRKISPAVVSVNEAVERFMAETNTVEIDQGKDLSTSESKPTEALHSSFSDVGAHGAGIPERQRLVQHLAREIIEGRVNWSDPRWPKTWDLADVQTLIDYLELS